MDAQQQTDSKKNWLDRIPLWFLFAGALFLGVAPWPREPQPHLIEKWTMLFDGTLGRPIDIFDFFLHSLFPALLIARLTRMRFSDNAGSSR